MSTSGLTPRWRCSRANASSVGGEDARRAAGALHIPLGQLPERIEELDPDTDYYVICRTGGRSMRASDFMVNRGYSAINVAGGSGAWLESGRPMEADGGAEPSVK